MLLVAALLGLDLPQLQGELPLGLLLRQRAICKQMRIDSFDRLISQPMRPCPICIVMPPAVSMFPQPCASSNR